MSIVSSILSLNDSSADRKIQFLGYRYQSEPNGNATNFPLSVLDIKAGDLVIFRRCSGSVTNDKTPLNPPSGFTTLTSEYANDTYDVTMETYYKIADGTEDVFSFNSLSDTTASVSTSVVAFRGTNGKAPYIEHVVSGSNAKDITWPTVTGLKPDSLILYISGTGHSAYTNPGGYTDPGDLDFFYSGTQGDTYDHSFGMGLKYTTASTSFAAGDWVSLANSASTSSHTETILIIQ